MKTQDLNQLQDAPPAHEAGRGPLTFGQERLWRFQQDSPDCPLYNFPVGLRMVGQLDIESLQQALDLIVERHEPLRTAFAVVGQAPRQIVQDAQPLDLRRIDLSSLSGQARES